MIQLLAQAGILETDFFDSFKEQNANRFFNCGVAEANMMGVAAGLAASGLRPVVYTIHVYHHPMP